MTRFKTIILASAAFGLAALAAPVSAQQAQAQAGAGLTAGMAIKDKAGGDVGTITAVEGASVTVQTDRHKAKLPANSMRAEGGVAVFGMTRDELNAAIDEQVGAAAAKIVAGASVSGSGGVALGTIEAVDAEFVTVKLTSGTSVRVPRKAVGAGANGAVLSITAAELEALAKQAGASEEAAAE